MSIVARAIPSVPFGSGQALNSTVSKTGCSAIDINLVIPGAAGVVPKSIIVKYRLYTVCYNPSATKKGKIGDKRTIGDDWSEF